MDVKTQVTPEKRKRRGPALTESTRKRRKAERVKKSNLNRISIGTQFERWMKFKNESGLKTHADVAKTLLDNFLSRPQPAAPQPSSTSKMTSTPFKFQFKQKKMESPMVSEISVAETTDSCSESTLSAEEIRKVKEVKTTSTGRQIFQKASSSFVDPINLSIDVSLMSDIEDPDEDDPDYVPEFEITAVLGEAAEGLEELAFEEVEFNMEQEEDEDVEGTEEDVMEGVRKVKDINECDSLADSIICLSFVEQLKVLAKTNVTKCVREKCETPSIITVKEEYVGSAVYLRWVSYVEFAAYGTVHLQKIHFLHAPQIHTKSYYCPQS